MSHRFAVNRIATPTNHIFLFTACGLTFGATINFILQTKHLNTTPLHIYQNQLLHQSEKKNFFLYLHTAAPCYTLYSCTEHDVGQPDIPHSAMKCRFKTFNNNLTYVNSSMLLNRTFLMSSYHFRSKQLFRTVALDYK